MCRLIFLIETKKLLRVLLISIHFQFLFYLKSKKNRRGKIDLRREKLGEKDGGKFVWMGSKQTDALMAAII